LLISRSILNGTQIFADVHRTIQFFIRHTLLTKGYAYIKM